MGAGRLHLLPAWLAGDAPPETVVPMNRLPKRGRIPR